MIDNLRPLSQDQRQDARDAAHDAITRAVGDKPTRAQFSQHASSEYGVGVTRLITVLCVLLLGAAFTPSAIRLYVIGSWTFFKTIDSTEAAYLVGLATVLSAETGQVVFSLALATLGATRPARLILYMSMLASTGIALVGNIQVALPGHVSSPFAWFEAIMPPVLTLSTAYVLKGQMLQAIAQRHANERAYQDALAAWKAATRDPEKHPRWSQFYANSLRDALLKANNRRKETLAAMTVADWRAAVYRELQSESWFDGHEGQPITARPTPPPPVYAAATGNGNGHHNGNGSY